MFMPDYRAGNPYQGLLAGALKELGLDVEFSSYYRRGLPISRAVRGSKVQLLHIHWPEAYFRQTNSPIDAMRALRFPFDLHFATRSRALVVTAHNLFPHGWTENRPYLHAFGSAYRQADWVIAHSEAARALLIDKYGLNGERVSVIPHGDLAPPGEPLPDAAVARAALRLPDDRRYIIMFGRVAPYKGISEVLEFWRKTNLASSLLIAGESPNPDYTNYILGLADGSENILLRLERLSEVDLRHVLAASSAALFNYRQILTSGAASLARSYGLPVILPSRLETVDLMEPDGRVLRFDSLDDLPALIEQAIRVGSDYDAAMPYREHCSWRQIAKKTIDVYSEALLSGKARQ